MRLWHRVTGEAEPSCRSTERGSADFNLDPPTPRCSLDHFSVIDFDMRGHRLIQKP